jgi:MYXO-CTERM domain-containing protein
MLGKNSIAIALLVTGSFQVTGARADSYVESEYGGIEGGITIYSPPLLVVPDGGSAALDGKVNGADFAILQANFNGAAGGASVWNAGDFSYHGAGLTINSASSTDLPEPGCIALAAVGAGLALRRRVRS